MQSVEILSDKAYTPEVCLHDVLDQVEGVESCVVLIQFKDGTAQTYSSFMSVRQLCFLSKVLDRRVYNLLQEMSE